MQECEHQEADRQHDRVGGRGEDGAGPRLLLALEQLLVLHERARELGLRRNGRRRDRGSAGKYTAVPSTWSSFWSRIVTFQFRRPGSASSFGRPRPDRLSFGRPIRRPAGGGVEPGCPSRGVRRVHAHRGLHLALGPGLTVWSATVAVGAGLGRASGARSHQPPRPTAAAAGTTQRGVRSHRAPRSASAPRSRPARRRRSRDEAHDRALREQRDGHEIVKKTCDQAHSARGPIVPMPAPATAPNAIGRPRGKRSATASTTSASAR